MPGQITRQDCQAVKHLQHPGQRGTSSLQVRGDSRTQGMVQLLAPRVCSTQWYLPRDEEVRMQPGCSHHSKWVASGSCRWSMKQWGTACFPCCFQRIQELITTKQSNSNSYLSTWAACSPSSHPDFSGHLQSSHFSILAIWKNSTRKLRCNSFFSFVLCPINFIFPCW